MGPSRSPPRRLLEALVTRRVASPRQWPYQPTFRRSPASPARRLVSAGHGRRRSSIATHPFSSSHLGARFRVQKHSELLSSVLYAPPTFSDPLAHVVRFAYSFVLASTSTVVVEPASDLPCRRRSLRGACRLPFCSCITHLREEKLLFFWKLLTTTCYPFAASMLLR